MLHSIMNVVGSALLLGALVATPAAAAPGVTLAANPNFYVASENAVRTVPAASGVLANDVGAQRAFLFETTAHGTLSLQRDGSFTYQPAPGYTGWDGFSYRAGAATGYFLTKPVPVFLYVHATPVANPDEFDVGTAQHFVAPRPGLLANDTDATTFGLNAQLVTPPAHGTASVGGFGRLDYRPTPGFTGVDTLTYRARNAAGVWSAPATVTLHVVANAAPVGQPDSYRVDEDSQIEENAPGLLANDSDADGDPLVAELVSSPTGGEIDLRPDGSFTYSTALNSDTDVTFRYRVGDGRQWSAPVLVSIDVIAGNDPPYAEGDYYGTSAGATQVVPAPGVLANDYDPIEFDGLTAHLLTQPATGTVTMQPDGGFTMVLDPGEYRWDSFMYEACDPGGCAVADVTLEIFEA